MSLISFALAWLPSWLTDGASLLLWLGAAAAGLAAIFLPITYRTLAIAAAVGLAALGGWTGGFAAADAQCEAAAARARAAALQVQVQALQSDSVSLAADAMMQQTFKGKADALTARAPAGACLPADVADGVRSLWDAP